MSRMARMPVDEVRVRAIQALRVRLERIAEHFPPGNPAAGAGPRGRHAPGPWPARLTSIERDPAHIARALAGVDPELAAAFALQSEQAAQGALSLLGHEPLQVGAPPRWHREPLSGIEAPARHWSRIDHLDSALVGDHKLLWELNRHQYLLAPAFCWLLNRDARHFALVQGHLESWLNDNPPRRGVNWVSSLEVAYRAIAWCWLLWMLREAPWRPELRLRLLGSLEAHARHVERYLSTYYSPNTHLTGEALGLFYVGTLLADASPARRWRARGAAILEAAVRQQVHPDGVYFEQASQYQRYTAEIYLHYLLLADATGWKVSQAVRDALGRVFAVLRTLASAAGHMPLLGDDDGGLLLPFDHRPPDDVRALLLAGAVALERPDLAPAGASPSFAYWLCGIDRTEGMRAARTPTPDWLDVYFACGGLAVLRDGWERSSAVAVIDAGPHGALSSGHSHADALAMTLSLGATALFIDRGTLTYCGPERNDFRSTRSHNTLEIDGTSSVLPAEPFKWLAGIPPRAQGLVCSSTQFSSFFGRAAGHLSGGRPSIHTRTVLHLRCGAWVIHDRGARSAAQAGLLRWQLAPGLAASVLEEDSVSIRDGAGNVMATIFLRGAAPVRIVPREVSPRLGQRVTAQCLELPLDSSLEALTIVAPASPEGAAVSFAMEAESPEQAVRWQDVTGSHRVIAGAPQGPPCPGGPAVHAGVSWRVESANSDTLLAALPAQAAQRSADVQAITHLPEESGRMIVITHTGGRWQQLGVEEPRRG
jgi:hypothetical protein